MQTDGINRSGHIVPGILIPLIIAALFAFMTSLGITAIGTFLIIALPVALTIMHFKLELQFTRLMAFMLPFSFEIPVTEGSMLRVPTEPMVIIASVILIAGYLKNPSRLKDGLHKKLLPAVPLITAFIITLPFSEMGLVSLKSSIVNITYILVFYIFLSIRFSEHPGLYRQLLMLYGMGFVLVMLWSVFRFWQWEWNPVVMRGIFMPFYNDHTIFGASSAVLAAFWAGSIYSGKPGIHAWASFLLFLVFTAGVLLSTSRAAYLSLIWFAGVMAMLMLNLRLRHLVITFAILGVTFTALSGKITGWMARVEYVSYDSQSTLTERILSTANITTDVSNIERLNRWVSAWRMFSERPLTGFGPGTYQFEYIPYQDPSLMNRLTVTDPWNIPEGSGGTAHSEIFLALSEMGVWGIAGWLVLAGNWIFIAFNRSNRHPYRKTIIVAFAVMSTYLFHGMFNNFLTTDKFAFLFWGTAAWLIANYNRSNNEQVLQCS